LGLVDAAILAVSFALGIWVWAIDSTELERVLGLGNHEAQFEAMVNAGRSRLDNLAASLSTIERLRWWNGELMRFASIVLTFFSLGIALATFRRRGGRSRRALRHAGILTTAVVASFVAVSIMSEVTLRKSGLLNGPLINPIAIFWGMLAENVGLAITVLWIILVAGRSWRTTPHWFDRCGRIAGFGWIGYALIGTPLAYLLLPG
jgi:hypothetical protein